MFLQQFVLALELDGLLFAQLSLTNDDVFLDDNGFFSSLESLEQVLNELVWISWDLLLLVGIQSLSDQGDLLVALEFKRLDVVVGYYFSWFVGSRWIGARWFVLLFRSWCRLFLQRRRLNGKLRRRLLAFFDRVDLYDGVLKGFLS